MTQIPAGWFPDPEAPPSNPPYLRYWDGSRWTEHRAAPPPYAAPVRVGPTTPDGVPLAGWWWRVLASLIDGAVVGIPAALITLPAQLQMQRRMTALDSELSGPNPDFGRYWHDYFDLFRDQLRWEWVIVALGIVYYAAMLRWKGATLGKLAVGLRVRLRERPGQLPWRAVALRVLITNGLGVLPYILLALGWWPVAIVVGVVLVIFVPLDLLWPLWDPKRQALHDKIAATNVVKER